MTYPSPTSAAVTAVMKANRKTGSRPEVVIRSALHSQGFRYAKNLGVRLPDGKLVRPDIVFKRRKIAVFVDGCFWHSCPKHGVTPKANSDYWGPKLRTNKKRDRLADKGLRKSGWVVVRVWEHESVLDAVAAIRDALTSE